MRPGKLFWRLMDHRPGTVFWIVSFLLLFLGMALFTQYKMTGRIDLASLVDRGADLKPFWDRNPDLEHTDSYPNTSLVTVRDRPSGRSAMLDMFVVSNARIQAVSCEGAGAFPPDSLYPGASDMVCFAIHKPDTGDGASFVFAASFAAKAEDSQVGQFYRDLFTRRGLKASFMQNSSRAVILEAEDEHLDTKARVAIRGKFDTAHAFFAVAEDFYRGGAK